MASKWPGEDAGIGRGSPAESNNPNTFLSAPEEQDAGGHLGHRQPGDTMTSNSVQDLPKFPAVQPSTQPDEGP